jgi:hypothetical protein
MLDSKKQPKPFNDKGLGCFPDFYFFILYLNLTDGFWRHK